DEGEGEGREEDHEEDVQHAFLGVLRADRDDLLRVLDRRLLAAVKLDVGLDELDRAVGAGGDRLSGGAGEPVDHRAADDQAEKERRGGGRKETGGVWYALGGRGH